MAGDLMLTILGSASLSNKFLGLDASRKLATSYEKFDSLDMFSLSIFRVATTLA